MTHRPTEARGLRLVASNREGPRALARGPGDEHSAVAKPGRSAIVPSWFLSLALHAALFIVLAISLPGIRGGIVGDPDGDLRSVGIWVGHSGDGSDGDGGGNASKTAPGDKESFPKTKIEPTPALAAATVPSPIRDVVSPPVTPVTRPASSAATQPSPASPTIGPGPPRGLFNTGTQPRSAAGGASAASGGRRGSRGSTPFFGIVDVGSRFVYVIDCSGSMYSHNAMGAAKSELLRSLRTLNRAQQYQIVFYDTDQRWLKAAGKVDFRFFSADEKTLRLANGFIAEIDPYGGTRHLPALELALRLHPDVIFFLTDGGKPGLSDLELEEVKRLNEGRTRIHCVQFKSPDDPDAALATDFLQKLAAQSDGRYVCRDVTHFDAPSAAGVAGRPFKEERR
jgi:hypothetical protein